METYLDCIPCFFRQALDAGRLAGAGEKTQKKILDRLSKEIEQFSLKSSPPEIGRIIYNLVIELTGKADPYKEIKQKSNKIALDILPLLEKRIEDSNDKLLTAIELAIAGNIIDYGAKNTLDIDKEVKNIIEDIDTEDRKAIFSYENFKKDLEGMKNILYLADNAGEIVFDKLLIRHLKEVLGKEIICAVRERPIINDALREDALVAGIDRFARIISSGSDAPGTVLETCSKEFIDIFNNAEFIISKGQGNFESLAGKTTRPIYFLFKVKCPIVARHVNCEVGSIILKKNHD